MFAKLMCIIVFGGGLIAINTPPINDKIAEAYEEWAYPASPWLKSAVEEARKDHNDFCRGPKAESDYDTKSYCEKKLNEILVFSLMEEVGIQERKEKGWWK